MRDLTGLAKRGSTYYFRARIPADLREHYGRAEVCKSLGTKDKSEAKQRGKLEALRWEQEFANARALLFRSGTPIELSPEELSRLSELYIAEMLGDDEFIRRDGRLRYGDMHSLYGKAMQRFSKESAEIVSAGPPLGTYPVMDAFLSKHGIKIAPDTAHYREAAYAFAKADQRLHEALEARHAGKPVDTPPVVPVVIRGVPQSVGGDTVEALYGYWKIQGVQRARSMQEAGFVVSLFKGLHPGLPASQITKAHVVALKDKMLADGNSPATVKKKVGLLKAVFQHAVDNAKLSINPASGVKVTLPKVAKKSRIPFSADDLKAIFTTEVYTENARPSGGRGEAAYWLPLLALWTGARLEELGQLTKSDIRQEAGAHYISISNEAGNVKTKTSLRRVPIHPELIRCGFLVYVDGLSQARLFPLLKSGEGRQITASFSQWWGRYLRGTVKVSDTRKVFHSFRHGFKEACRVSGIAAEHHDRLTGHGKGSVGDGYGGEEYPLGPLVEAMSRLRYEGLDLSHLYKQ